MRLICPSSPSSLLDLSDGCVRGAWATILPATLVAVLAIPSLRYPQPVIAVFKFLSSPWSTFLSLTEAEAYELNDTPALPEETKSSSRAPLWFTLLLVVVATFEVIAWTVVAAFTLSTGGDESTFYGVRAAILGITWVYAAVKPVLKSRDTPSYDLLALYILHLIGGVLLLGGVLYEHSVYLDPLPPPVVLVGYSANLAAVLLLLSAVFSRPVATPSSHVDKEEIGKGVSPEDYTSLWGWISFTWVEPLIRRGTYETLNEKDVWEMSPTMRAKPVFLKFNGIKRKTLLRQLWTANGVDITIDFVLTFVSVVFNYAGPFFLKRIIDAIGDPTPERRALAYIFACLAFCSTVLKAESDVLHLWYGRRAAVRIRSQLMSAIYDKALKRKDFSGVVNKDAGESKTKDGETKKETKAEKKAREKADDPKAGADIGKIVNLMAVDSNRIAMIVSGLYFIYGAPFEIIIACTFLYQLLGWSAFAGFVVLILGWPLNSYIARRAIRISKGVVTARDKRMSVLNEIIGAIKFIKFFAWEERWIQRAMDSRQHELKWLVKSRLNSIMFQVLWTTAPILVSVISFMTFVAQGNELTLGVAFTAIALFNMIRQPLNVIPSWIVQILQTRVALQRIETFLNEEEVDEQVSSIKRAKMNAGSRPTYSDFGLKNASFRWNEVEEKAEDGKSKDKKNKKSRDSAPSAASDTTVVDENATETRTERVFELSDVSVVFPDGELTVITGPTASGKTALLLGLLGEMTLLPGGEILMSKEPEKVDEHGLTHAISYAAQTPWLQHQSIKDNIIFGNPFDEARYKAVVECCALGPDLKMLEDGDQTEIGARGVSLSGGQKARVALARAVYARTKYVLLDDPLSAVDSHTARFLYERLFLGPLMKHRTVVLVTHHVELVLPGTHYLIRMLDGRIDVQGSVKELRSRGVLESVIIDAESEPTKTPEDENNGTTDEIKEEEEQFEPSAERDPKPKKPRKLIKDEERETGSVKWVIYKTYLKASSYWTWAILMTIVLIVQLLGFTERYWIMVWGEAYGNGNGTTQSTIGILSTGLSPSLVEHQAHFSDAIAPHHFVNHPTSFSTTGIRDRLPPAQEKPFFYVGVYALIGLTMVVVSICSVATQYTGALRASKNLFKRLLVSVVHATMRWQDVTPAGRMLNRFSKDIETVDTSLASSLQAVNSSLANFASSVIVVIFVFPLFIFPASIFGFIYYRLAIGYLNTGRDLRRMESTSRSPIFSGFGELLEGVVTVRAFSAEHRFRNTLYSKIDLTLGMWYNFWMTNRWLLLRFDCLGALAVFTTTLFALSGLVDAGWAALSITSTMAFTSNIYWACRFWTSLELDLNSVERVVEYLDLPQEPPGIIEGSRPPAHWPSSTGPNENSLMVVDNLVIRYAPELPAVLHNVSFSLKARERVGLLGRTGSGKSTLAMSVLRFVDPTEGRILIDGIDITTIGVQDLRSRLTFIPQDATLFSGTLRDNLDPFRDYSDEECIDALYRVQMLSDSAYQSQRSSRTASRAASIHSAQEDSDENATSEVSSVTATSSAGVDKNPTKISLDTEISAGGLNFSSGQRQLIAMARALLRQSSVIVLDEATSSIDFETDAKIQSTIREEFGNSLLLTVAHRLRTIIDYDRLIVLDQGKVAEFDTPWNLINKDGGIFRTMCLKSGTFNDLEKAAKAKAIA